MRRSLSTNAIDWPLGVLVLFDVALAVAGHRTISTCVRERAHKQPLIAAAIFAGLAAHFLRPDSYAHYDPLSVLGRRLGRVPSV
jgi:hypothetical protein